MNRFSFLLFVVFCITIGCTNNVDLLVHNANIYTANEEFDKATAFVVDNGKFVDVGGEELVNKYNPVNTVDARGLAIYPGFMDAHCHLLAMGFSEYKTDLSQSNSLEEVINTIVKHQEKHNKNIILGKGWDQNRWVDTVYPDNVLLSIVFPNTPVILESIDGHAYLVNQKAIEMAGIDETTQVNGGQIIKRKGKLTGVLIDNAKEMIDRIIPEFTREDKTNALIKAQKICFENGFTTITQAGISKKDIYLIDSLQRISLMKLRVYAMIENDPESINYFLNKGIFKTDYLNVRSVKIFADGAFRSREATLKQDYNDQEGWKSSLLISKDSLMRIANLLKEKSFQMNTYAAGDNAYQTVLDVYNEVLKEKDDPRWRIEHAQFLDPNDFSKFNPKIIPSIQPSNVTIDMKLAEYRLGSESLSGAYAYKDLLDWSGRLALGTNSPLESINPFEIFYAAVHRKVPDGLSSKTLQYKNALTRNEALMGMTLWGAYANFEEAEKGSIEVGKFADFIILDQDIMKVDIDKVIETKIVATILNGKIVFSNRL